MESENIMANISVVGEDIITKIMNYINPDLLSFSLITCSYWHRIIRESLKLKSTSFYDQTIYAARHGYIGLLEYLRGCRTIKTINISRLCEEAAQGGHLKCLKYLCEIGWEDNSRTKPAKDGYLKLWENEFQRKPYWNSFICESAAHGGNIECLKYAHENGCKWDSDTCTKAANGGHLECLKYAHENGCEWNFNTCTQAARRGHLNCLKYAHENGCEWNVITCEYAALGGHLECLKYLHENGCSWDAGTCMNAALGKHLNCLKYAHENGCEWDARTVQAAAMRDVECLKYAIENECEWDDRVCEFAAVKKNVECLNFVKNVLGCNCKYHQLKF